MDVDASGRSPDDRIVRSIMLLLCAQAFLMHMGQQLVVPILPLYAQTFGVSTVAIGTMLTVQSIPRIFASIPAGHFSDRLGAHRVLLVASLFSIVSAVTGAAATTFVVLVISRVIQGVAAALSITSGLTYAAGVGTPERRGRRISIYQGANLLGNSMGPVFGGLISQAFGYRMPFMVYGVIAAIVAVWIWRGLPDPRDVLAEEPVDGAPRVRVSTGLNAREAWALLGTVAIGVSCLVGFLAAYTRSGTRNFGLVMLADLRGATEGEIGLLMSVIFLATATVIYVAGVLVDRFGPRMVLVPGYLVMAGGMYLLTVERGFGLFLAAAVLFGLGAGLGNPVPAMYVAEVAPAHQRGTALGIFRTLSDVGLIAGPLFMGWLIVAIDVAGGILVNAAMVVVGAILFGMLGPARERTQAS